MKGNSLVCQFIVDASIARSSTLNISLILGAKVYLQDFGSVDLTSSSFPFNFSRIDDIIKNGILNSCQGATTRTKPLSLLWSSICLSENSTLCNDQYVSTREFLLKFSNKALLNSPERLIELERNINDNSLVCSTVHLLRSSNVQILKGSLELRRGLFESKNFFSDGEFEIISGYLWLWLINAECTMWTEMIVC